MSEAPALSVEETSIDDLDAVLAEEHPPEVPSIDLTCVNFTPELLETIPQEIAEQYGVLPVYVRKGRKKKKAPAEPSVLYIAAPDPPDPAAVEDCSLCSNMKVRVFVAPRDEIRKAIPTVYGGGSLDRPAPPPLPPSVAHPGTHRHPPPPPTPPTPQLIRGGSMPELPLIRPATSSPAPAASAPAASVPAPSPSAPAPELGAPAAHADKLGTSTLLSPPEGSAEAIASAQSTAAPLTAPTPVAVAPQAAPLGPPRVVVLGSTAELLDCCREAVAPLGGIVEDKVMGRASDVLASGRPDLLLVAEEIYPFDRRAFNLLAFQIGVPLVIWSAEMDPADLQALLLAARCGPSVSIPPPAG